jgi:hypothetical protein
MNDIWKRCALFAGGMLAGSYGLKILGSKDAKKFYTHCTAGALRMKDEVMRDVQILGENCGDIKAEAEEINERRRQEEEARRIEDAKEILRCAEEAKAEEEDKA